MGQIIHGTYEILGQLGAGGGGIVYLGRHLRLDKRVVLKADRRKLTTPPEILRREVDALKNLSHTNIPQVYDYIQEGNRVYTVMDYIEGESLDKPLKRGERFSQAQVISWAFALLDALRYLHTRPPNGILHCDIKPANIMLTPGGEVRLIDFNIAYALGDEGTALVAYSRGYASPEHYGRTSSSFRERTQEAETDLLTDTSASASHSSSGSTSGTRSRRLPLDVRSDIYSLGATLYHLLTGIHPPARAEEVPPIRDSSVSPAVSDIIRKAMMPDPAERYQTAEEMYQAFSRLHDDDLRVTKLRRRSRIAALTLAAVFLLGGLSLFMGLKQQTAEDTAARAAAEQKEAEERDARERAELAEALERREKDALDAVTAGESLLLDGDAAGAAERARFALSLESDYAARAEKLLAEACGVYDLSSAYRPLRALILPSEPLKLSLSPEGGYAAVLTSGEVRVFSLPDGTEMARLPADPSALSCVVFPDENRLVYAGAEGICCYDIAERSQLWMGEPATGISCSGNGAVVAAVYRGESLARVYRTDTGELLREIDFEGKRQRVPYNDRYQDPESTLFLLNQSGSRLAVSFEDGGLWICETRPDGVDLELLDTSEYQRFEGGFYGNLFAYSGMGADRWDFRVIDINQATVTAYYSSTAALRVRGDEQGIYLAEGHTLVCLDPLRQTQTELTRTDADIVSFAVGQERILLHLEDGGVSVFDRGGAFLEKFREPEALPLYVQRAEMLLLASHDRPLLRVLREDRHEAQIVAEYDPAYSHTEARTVAAGQRFLLYSSTGLRVQDRAGNRFADISFPQAEAVYDPQMVRDAEGERLEVAYNDGNVLRFAAEDGQRLPDEQRQPHSPDMTEEFFTNRWRIVSPLHGAPEVYDRESGALLGTLEPDGYLTYVTQLDDGGVMTEYMDASGRTITRYGVLLNERMEVLARLPNLCDVLPDGTLLFDDQRGALRQTRVFSREELLRLEVE